MEYLNVIAAAAACWAFGAVYYMALAKPWVEASGVATDESGQPANKSPMPFVISFICMILVAGMMRHMLEMAGIVSLGKAALTGLGIGAFFIVPWMALNHAYGGRPAKLTLIDGGYAVSGCAIIGLVLALF